MDMVIKIFICHFHDDLPRIFETLTKKWKVLHPRWDPPQHRSNSDAPQDFPGEKESNKKKIFTSTTLKAFNYNNLFPILNVYFLQLG